MIDYHLRCTQQDVPNLLALAVQLGVLRYDEETSQHYAVDPGACWDVIGTVHRPTGNTIETPEGPIPEMLPVLAPDGEPYWHANLRLPYSLMDRAQEVGGPDIALALTQLPRWFVADINGNPIAPSYPARVFA